jgi:TPR repeat protein
MKNNKLVCQYLCSLLLLFGIIQPSWADWMLEERFKSVQQQALDGKIQAMYELGRMYERGRGTAVNFSQAAEWYQKASTAGNVAAKAQLGILYFEGRGVPQNHQQAYRLLNEAAKADIPAAQYQLGLMYEWGTVVPQNKRQAMKWYEKARQGGDYRAKDKLAQLRSQQIPVWLAHSGPTTTAPFPPF